MATIRDIAKMANVSVATVSNVLNGKQGAASPEKVQEIFDVVKQLNYHPNYMARNLKSKHSRTIGIITEDLTVHQTPGIVNGIEEFCETCGYEILLANMRLYQRYGNNFENEVLHNSIFKNVMVNLMSKQIDGIIYVGYHCRPVTNYPSDSSFPFVYAYCIPKDQAYPSVLFNDELAGQQVGEALLSRGHRKIGLITGPSNSLNSRARLRGFQKALFDYGVPYNVYATVSGDWSKQSGYQAMDALMKQGVTAVFAFCDAMASGAYSYCLQHHIAIGKDLALFGYDNSVLVDAYTPALSSVAPPLRDLGQKSAQLVLSLIQGKPVSSESIYIPCNVIVRESVSEKETPSEQP